MSKDFLIALKYQNGLPSAPSGPFLKEVGMYHKFDEVSEFRTSTLEKNYVWQPHFGPDLGVKIDLVDQEAILANPGQQVVDQSDLRYLTGTVEKGRGKLRKVDQKSKPWWLRDTTYIDNNIFNAPAKVKEGVLKNNAARISKIKDKMDPLSLDAAQASFDDVQRTVNNIITQKSGQKRKVSRVLNILPLLYSLGPDEDAGDGHLAPCKSHALVRFDEDPASHTVTVKSEASQQDVTASAVSGAEIAEDEKKWLRMKEGIITNLRQSVKRSDVGKGHTLEVSLVAPVETEARTEAEDSEGSGSVANEETRKSAQAQAQGELFHWVKDYRMDVQDTHITDSFLFVMPSKGSPPTAQNATPSASSSSGVSAGVQQGEVRFLPVSTRMDLKKMPMEDSQPHECLVLKER